MSESGEVARLVPTKSEAEIAEDLKVRIEEASKAMCAVMDEAMANGLLVQWDSVAPAPPYMKCRIINLRLIKTY